jgi:hypothetical protein
MLEAALAGGEALGEPVTAFPEDRGVAGLRSPGRQGPSQPGALTGSPAQIEIDLASR